MAYQQISGSRQYTMGGAAEIPYSAKILWLNENCIVDRDEREEYLIMILALDSAYLEYQAKKAKVK